MAPSEFHFPSGGKYTKETAFWEASHFLSRDFLLWMWLGKKLHLRPEILCLLALGFALLTAMLVVGGHWWWALLCMHIHTALDCADGALARFTHRANRFGRFLDTVCDGLGMTMISAALSWQLSLTHSPLLAVCAEIVLWLCIFLQCSLANYANIKYAELSDNTTINSRTDEQTEGHAGHSIVERILRFIYKIIFSWQDSWCVRVFARMERALRPEERQKFYCTKFFLAAHSFFFFGIAIQSILLTTALTSLEHALIGYITLSITAHCMLLHAKMTYAKNTELS